MADGERAEEGRALLTPADVVAMPPVPCDARVAWGRGERQFGELRLPDGRGPHPVVAVLHGGCWQSRADLGYLGRLSRALTRLGWAAWTQEFRRLDDPGGEWPAIFHDVSAGFDHLRELARHHPLDLGRLVALGHSSGGHLALWLAGRHRLPAGAEVLPGRYAVTDTREAPSATAGATGDPLRPRGVLAVAGIADLAHYHAMGPDRRGCDDAVERLLGGTPSERPERIALASPTHLLPLGVPQLLLTGDRDAIVPPPHGEAWVARARRAGDPARHVVLPGCGHFEPVSPWTPGWAAAEREIGAFLEGVGAEGRASP